MYNSKVSKRGAYMGKSDKSYKEEWKKLKELFSIKI